jgi:hypothetical protein
VKSGIIYVTTPKRYKTNGIRTCCLLLIDKVVELEHLKIKTRLTNEKFASVMGECVI